MMVMESVGKEKRWVKTGSHAAEGIQVWRSSPELNGSTSKLVCTCPVCQNP